MTVSQYEQFIRDSFGGNASQILTKYSASSKEEVQHQMERITKDIDFASAARFVAGYMANLNQSMYLYKFTYVLPGQPNGAYHTSELYFVFRPSYWNPNPTSSKVSDHMMDLWVRFAKTGNPNGGINVTWPEYSTEKDQYLDIGVTPVIKTGY